MGHLGSTLLKRMMTWGREESAGGPEPRTVVVSDRLTCLISGMLRETVIWVFFFLLQVTVSEPSATGFTFNGFSGANLTLRGSAAVTPEGLLRLTYAAKQQGGHAFYRSPLRLRTSPASGEIVRSFSSTFIFGIVSQYPEVSGHGLTLLLAPSDDLSGAMGSLYLGLFNKTTDGSPANHLAAVELDTVQNLDLDDINDNHVGIDVNSVRSLKSTPAGYFTVDGAGVAFRNLTLVSGEPMQVWVEYSGVGTQLNVTMSPMGVDKPAVPLLSATVNLSEVFLDTMYVGFSSTTGAFFTSHYVLGWSFQVDGAAPPLDVSALPRLPRSGNDHKRRTLALWLSLSMSSVALAAVVVAVLTVVRKTMFSELLEDWELDYGAHRIPYRDLFRATKGFRDKQLLGTGGFGRVYRGVLPTSGVEVAVKRVSHESRQGMREFIAEIVSIGRLRHRNLVPLQGYCRRKGELLLVYDLMPNGSLDKFLFDNTRPPLEWKQRFHIIQCIAAGLLYLHEGWEQVVIHRDVKPSNVLVDGEFNGRLGDFGLARLYDRGTGPQTTHVVGTMGYLAPELARTGKATKATDVFAFGVFVLEVACGRRPIEPDAAAEELILVDWVVEKWQRGALLEAVDPKLGGGDAVPTAEAEMVLALGLHCAHPSPAARPSMLQVTQVLVGDAPLSAEYLSASVLQMKQTWAFDEYPLSFPSWTTAATRSPRPDGGGEALSITVEL